MPGTDFTETARFEAEVLKCTKCGFCASWCPVFREEKTESFLPRGKNIAIRKLLSSETGYTEELAHRLNACTLCMTCQVNCPTRTSVPRLVVSARADRTRAKGLGFPYNLVYRSLLPRRTLFGRVVRAASQFQGITMRGRGGTVRHLPNFLAAVAKGRRLPRIAPKFLRQVLPEVSKPSGPAQMKIGYFAGCMTEFVSPSLAVRTVRFLNRHGIEVVVPRNQGCCGAPVYLGAGDFATGRKLADANVGAFRDLSYVVTGCATCASAMKDYVTFLAHTPRRIESYSEFAKKIIDVSSFLVDVLKLPAGAYRHPEKLQGKKITWHDPCHLGRHLGVRAAPRQVLSSIAGVEYVEMPDADKCCGMAGTFSLHYARLSRQIADRKMAGILATGADVVATACPGCELQIADALHRAGADIPVVDLAELLE